MEGDLITLAALGAFAYLAVLLDLRLGLGITLLCIALSPEIPPTIGIRNLRFEDLLMPALLLGWLMRASQRREALVTGPLQGPILLYLFWSALSALRGISVGGADPVYTFFFFGKIAEYFLFYLVFLNNVRTIEEAKAFGVLAIVAACTLGSWGIREFLTAGEIKLSGPTGETSNVLGGYFVFHLGLVVGLLFETPGVRARLLLLAAFLLLFLPFLLTLSRTSYAALFGSLVMVGLVRRRSLLLWMATGAIGLPYLLPPYVLARVATIFDIFGSAPPSSWTSRVYAWETFSRRVFDNPFLGQGVGTMSPGRIDNGYVHMLIEVGVLGLGAFLWLLGKSLYVAHQTHARYPNRPFFRGLALGFLCGTLGLMLHALGAPSFTAIRTMEPFMVLLGLVGVLWNRAAEWGETADEPRCAAPDLLYVRASAP